MPPPFTRFNNPTIMESVHQKLKLAQCFSLFVHLFLKFQGEVLGQFMQVLKQNIYDTSKKAEKLTSKIQT